MWWDEPAGSFALDTEKRKKDVDEETASLVNCFPYLFKEGRLTHAMIQWHSVPCPKIEMHFRCGSIKLRTFQSVNRHVGLDTMPTVQCMIAVARVWVEACGPHCGQPPRNFWWAGASAQRLLCTFSPATALSGYRGNRLFWVAAYIACCLYYAVTGN